MSAYRRILHRSLIATGLIVFMACISLSATSTVLAQNVTQGYKADATLQKGMIVGLNANDGNKVEALGMTNAKDMLGVVVAATDSPVSLSSPDGEQQVFVATHGQYDVLVSTQNGAINVGDFVTISAINGVGMKTDNSQQLVVGKALKSFDGKKGVESTQELATSSGQKQVQLGRISLDITVAHNPFYQTEKQENVPKFLLNAVKLVTDRPVAPARIYSSLVVVVLTAIIAGGLLYSGVRSGMVAIGRNPLAKHSIFRNLIQVTIMSLIVFVIGLIAVYLLLRI